MKFLLFTLILLTFSLFPAAQNPTSEKNSEIISLTLDKTSVTHWCPRFKERSCSREKSKISIKTTISPINVNPTFYYSITGGQIIGSGSEVVWEFGETTPPGKHTISVGVGVDYVMGETISKTIELFECDHCYMICECPNIGILGPSKPVKANDTIVFEATVSGGDRQYTYYTWTISGGSIIFGEKSSKVFIKIPSKPEKNAVTATVEIGSDPACNCPNSESKSVEIALKTP
ncbi:MAG: hypothetical protein H7070_11905 [Saprospiraceae bacterium]|nr:hypothetical protein [Pyrinomonadaceae bacterium]